MHQISAALMISDGPRGFSDPSQMTLPEDTVQDRQHWWDLLQPLFAELILVAPDPVAELVWKGLIVNARYHFPAPLAAVRAALRVAQHDQLLIVDPALSIITPDIIAGIAASAQQRWDVIGLDGGVDKEIVPMVFHRRCLKIMDHHLARTDSTMADFYHQVRLHTIDMNPITS